MAWSRGLAVLVVAGFTGTVASAGGCSGGGGTADAGDAATDTKPPPQDSGADAGMCGAVACEVCDVSGYFPSAMSPPMAHTGACSTTQIQDYVTACGANETATSCDAWQTAQLNSDAGTGCLDCIYTDQTGPSWGLLVCDAAGLCSYNSPGCIDLALGQTGLEKNTGGQGSCGDLLQDSYGCQDYACGSCADPDGGTGSYDTCTNNALAHECASYDAAFSSTTGPCGAFTAVDGGPDPNVCFAQSDADLTVMTTLFCGAP